MANIFISYNRESEAIVRTLLDDIQTLGHTVWCDQELSGGQAWWDQILATIRDCDVFIFVLNSEALNSPACKREYGYAADLGKPILPVLVSGSVSTNLLPPALSKIQFVDYRKQDRDAAFRLARALTSAPPAKPLPDPLPTPPEAPISYLGRLSEQLETTSTLGYDEQSALVVDLKRSLRESGTSEDTRTLLERLRKRRDLYATIAEEIDEMLSSTTKASTALPRTTEPAPFSPERSQKVETPSILAESKLPEGQEPLHSFTPPAPISSDHKPTMRERVIGALFGAVLGTGIGVLAMSTFRGEGLLLGLLTGAGGAIAGAFSGTNQREIIVVLLGTVSGWLLFYTLFYMFQPEGAFAAGGVFGAPLGAILGAIVGLKTEILRKLVVQVTGTPEGRG